jgi:hypothetical protein
VLHLLHPLGLSSLDLELLQALSSLEVLKIECSHEVHTLAPIAGLSCLTKLEILAARGISNLQPLSSIRTLRHLRLERMGSVRSLQPLSSLPLQHLVLARLDAISSLEALRSIRSLRHLALYGIMFVTVSLEPLGDLSALQSLSIHSTLHVRSLLPLTKLTSLQDLSLSGLFHHCSFDSQILLLRAQVPRFKVVWYP